MFSPLTIRERTVGDVHVFVLSGRLIAYDGTRTLHETVSAAVAAGARACLLDLEGLAYVDSAGVGALVEVYRLVTMTGGQLKLLHPSHCARRVLGISHLTAVFDVFDSEAEAILNLNRAPGIAAPHPTA